MQKYQILFCAITPDFDLIFCVVIVDVCVISMSKRYQKKDILTNGSVAYKLMCNTLYDNYSHFSNMPLQMGKKEKEIWGNSTPILYYSMKRFF